jgi:type IV pilus assembly protein PilV
MNSLKYNCRNQQKGIALLEVLIALFVLGVGLLGVFALQAESMRLNQQAYSSSQALFIASDAVERMRTNVSALPVDQQATPLLAQVFPDADRNNWLATVTSRLPGGEAVVEQLLDSTIKITLRYSELALSNENRNADARNIEYVLFARL